MQNVLTSRSLYQKSTCSWQLLFGGRRSGGGGGGGGDCLCLWHGLFNCWFSCFTDASQSSFSSSILSWRILLLIISPISSMLITIQIIIYYAFCVAAMNITEHLRNVLTGGLSVWVISQSVGSSVLVQVHSLVLDVLAAYPLQTTAQTMQLTSKWVII